MSRPELRARAPLAWPARKLRTTPHDRARARFHKEVPTGLPGDRPRPRPLTLAEAADRLAGELGRLGVDLGSRETFLTTNYPVRLTEQFRSGQPEPQDPGAAVYFTLKGEPKCMACDAWTRLADNVAAIAAHISALRATDRYGVSTLEEIFRAYTVLPERTPTDWPSVLGLDRRTATRDLIEAAYRRLAKVAHPDLTGGEHGKWRS
jgi:hypothetical protein